MGTNDGKKDKSANETVMDTKNAQNDKSANENNRDTNNAEKAKSANQRVTQRSTRSASTRESISNKPDIYIVSVKSTKFRLEETVENFQWLVDQDKIILELKD